ncbi:MAG: hypothetical protein ACPGXY_05255 [Alphaproteobacteria bacterium]
MNALKYILATFVIVAITSGSAWASEVANHKFPTTLSWTQADSLGQGGSFISGNVVIEANNVEDFKLNLPGKLRFLTRAETNKPTLIKVMREGKTFLGTYQYTQQALGSGTFDLVAKYEIYTPGGVSEKEAELYDEYVGEGEDEAEESEEEEKGSLADQLKKGQKGLKKVENTMVKKPDPSATNNPLSDITKRREALEPSIEDPDDSWHSME